MKIKSILVLVICGMALLFAGCNGTLALRSVVYNTTERAYFGGVLHDNAKSGSHSIQAEKTTTDSGKVTLPENAKF